MLPVYRYEGLEPLLTTLAEKVIAPAEEKVKAFEERRRIIEAKLTERGPGRRPAGSAIKRATARPRSARRSAPRTDPN